MQQNKFTKNGSVTMASIIKKLFFIFFTVCGLCYFPWALASSDSLRLPLLKSAGVNTQFLTKMHNVITTQNYRVVFVRSVGNKLNVAFEYTHAQINNKPYAKLLYLEGPAKQIILNENTTSYYQQGNDPFAIKSNRIIEAFPSILFNDFTKLNSLYDYISIGKGRVADRSVQLIRVLPKDKDRNNYLLWLDEKTFMPLRIDLYDIHNRLIEQFKVVSLTPFTSLQTFLTDIRKVKHYPILALSDKTSPLSDQWKVNWVPNGFLQKTHSQIENELTDIDTRLYSDGVFAFTVTLSNHPLTMKSYSLQSGNQIIYVTHSLNKEITIIGDLPLETIKKIAEHIEINASS